MSTLTWKVENDLCRCCLAEGSSFLSICDPIYNLGTTEIFMDLLKSTLDIELVVVNDVATAMKICDPCVQRLRDANNFKKQVQKCEFHFRGIHQDLSKAGIPNIQLRLERSFDDEVKEEFPVYSDSDTDSESDGDRFDGEDSENKDLLLERNKPKKRKKKAKEGLVGGRLRTAQTKTGKRRQFKLKPTDYTQEGDTYICNTCNKKFPREENLRRHIRDGHKKYNCPYCNKDFTTKTKLVIHKLDEHDVDDRFKCDACESYFNIKIGLVKHIEAFHKRGKKYKCKNCNYETFSSGYMSKHMLRYKIEKNLKCRFCSKAFLRKSTLNFHERIHTDDRRKMCDVCGEAFVQKASLNYHMAKHHPDVKF